MSVITAARPGLASATSAPWITSAAVQSSDEHEQGDGRRRRRHCARRIERDRRQQCSATRFGAMVLKRHEGAAYRRARVEVGASLHVTHPALSQQITRDGA
jgi:hypothetical protein